ncbi:MAG: hypothetical protein IK031_06240 [Bacteroidales bacterium]|nr:hypothetical protein [Bacteroidales bacterium]
MNKYLLLLASLAAAAGCSLKPEDTPVQEETVTYSIFATGPSVDVKATISDAGKFSWSAGDEIAVYNSATGSFVTFRSAAGDGNFTAEAAPGAVFTTAYYPASVAVPSDPGKVKLPTSYTQAEAAAGKTFPMMATVDGGALSFKHLASLLKITVNDVPAEATSITVSSDKALGGTFAIGKDGSGNDAILAADGSGDIGISLSNAAASNVTVYVPVPVGTYSYTVTLRSGSTALLSQTTTSAKTLERASLHILVPLTYTSQQEEPQEIDHYALIGYHKADESWSSDIALKRVDGFPDWRVVTIGTAGDVPHFSFKFRKDGGWSEQIGGVYRYNRAASTCFFTKTTDNSDFDVYPGTQGDYDVYIKSDKSTVFVLPAGTSFNVPGRIESEDLVSQLYIVGGLNGHVWDMNFPLEFASSANHDWYALRNASKIEGWGAMVFKIYNGSWGAGVNIGFSWELNPDNASFIGDMETVYPLWLREGDDDIPNIHLGTDGSAVDIYIKADLSQIFTLHAGSAFSVPSESTKPAPDAVFIGDSITYFWNHADRGDPSFFTSHNYLAKGVEGQTSTSVRNRFAGDVIAKNPSKVVILCGANDFAGNDGSIATPAFVRDNIAAMAESAKAAGIKVFIGSVLPCNTFWWAPSVNPADNIIAVNSLLKTLCESNGYTYVNYYDALVDTSTKGLKNEYSLDGCHPTKAGYTAMEGVVLPLLTK